MRRIKKNILMMLAGAMMLPQLVFAQTFNDPYISQQWYLSWYRMDQVWNYAQGQGQIIAVIDSGVDVDHPDLINQIWTNQKEILGDFVDNDRNGYVDDVHGWDFIDQDNDPHARQTANCKNGNANCDDLAFHHGTAVSGIIAAQSNNGLDVAGLAPLAKIMPIRALDSFGSGTSGDVISGIDYAIKNGATIINMSFAGNQEDPDLSAAIERAFNAGVAVVVAAGNREGTSQIDLDVSPRYPVCSRGLSGQKISFGAGAHDEDGKLSDFSNYGSLCLDAIAAGESITALMVYDPQQNLNAQVGSGFRGTSLAAPMISGAIALIRSYRPTLSISRVYQLLRDFARDVSTVNGTYASKIGAGALDILPIMEDLSAQSPELSAAGILRGDLLKSPETTSVYYYAQDGKRYVFPDGKTFLSWYPDFSGVKTVSSQILAQIQFGGVVTIRPGTMLVKVTTSPQVYAIDKNGTLRWITNEDVARGLYGDEWYKNIKDLQDAFFFNYRLGPDVVTLNDYSIASVLIGSRTISEDKGL